MNAHEAEVECLATKESVANLTEFS
jgi:hypothetical protein